MHSIDDHDDDSMMSVDNHGDDSIISVDNHGDDSMMPVDDHDNVSTCILWYSYILFTFNLDITLYTIAFCFNQLDLLEGNAPAASEPKNDVGLFINRSLSDNEKNIVSVLVTVLVIHYFLFY